MSAAILFSAWDAGAAACAVAWVQPVIGVAGPGEAMHYGLVEGAVVLLFACLVRGRWPSLINGAHPGGRVRGVCAAESEAQGDPATRSAAGEVLGAWGGRSAGDGDGEDTAPHRATQWAAGAGASVSATDVSGPVKAKGAS